MRTPTLAVLCGLFGSTIASCDGIDEPKVALDYPAELVEIPGIYRGHWSNSLKNCDLETGDPTEWLFVGPETVGSFEHMYPVREITLFEEKIEFTTQFGDRMVITAIADGRATVSSPNLNSSLLVRCPKESDD